MHKDYLTLIRKTVGKPQVIDANMYFKRAHLKGLDSGRLANMRRGLLNGAIIQTGMYWLYPIPHDTFLLESVMHARTHSTSSGKNPPKAS